MSLFRDVSDWLDPGVWAIYIVGAVTISVAVWQFKSKFRQSKKADVFAELSKDIETASELVNKISDDSNSIISYLANAANLASSNFDPSVRTQQEVQAEIERRLNEIEEASEKHKTLSTTIFSSFRELLSIIKKVEKSTVASSKSKMAARYLFYTADEQYKLVNSATVVLQSFSVTPALGDKPNISSETFNAFIGLLNLINTSNQILVTYLEDLEVILHNDLVKSIYKKASFGTIPVKHLRPEGLIDKRVKDSLL